VVRLTGLGETGLGEDVNYEAAEQTRWLRDGCDLPLLEARTIGELERSLEAIDPFRHEPRYAEARDYRRWAIASAAVDLALRQRGVALCRLLGLEPRPVRFVKSMGLRGPGIDPVRGLLARQPDLEFKLDASTGWDGSTVAALRETGAVRIVDLKGAYRGTPVDLPADTELYRRVAEGLDDVWIEDPDWNEATATVLEPHFERISWDAPIHSVADIGKLPHPPRGLNIKPSRFGSFRRLFEAYAWCVDRDVTLYGGGQYELGPGRGQIQYLASLFHPYGPNDVAPVAYHAPEKSDCLPTSPLTPTWRHDGFAWSTGGEER
jgi:L-alanine-DL-glutamate epimerase-like enolase superfamily enzyme